MSMPLKFAFFGTPQVAVWVLDELEKAGMLPQVIVTAPDKPAGRGLALTAPPAKEWAAARGIPVLQPEKLNAAFREALAAYGSDVFLVAAYGKILRSDVLTMSPHGCLNVHPSLLPKYRGAAPIESQILADEQPVGVSLMLMDEEMDHGPILAQAEVGTPSWPLRRIALSELLARAGGALAAARMPEWVAGARLATPQDHAAATYTRKTEKEDGRISLADPDRQNYLKYCAYESWPGVYFFARKEGRELRVNVTRASFEDGVFKVERIVPAGRSEQGFSYLAQNGWEIL